MSLASTTRSSLTERTALVDSMHRAESLKRSNQAMRDRIMELRNALRVEQQQSTQAHKDKVQAINETRDVSEMEQNRRLLEQETKLLKERAQEIKRVKEDLERKRKREVEEVIRQRDEAEAARHRQMQQERLEAENALREEVKKETAAEVESRLGGEISSLQRALLDTEQQLARLERLYDTKCKADAEKAEQIKSMRQQHLEELTCIRKENSSSLKNEMSEMRDKERQIRDLQTELSALRRNNDRLSSEKSRLEEDVQRHKAADSLSKRTPKKLLPAMGSYDPAAHGPDSTVKRNRTPSKADAAEIRKLKAKTGDQARDIRRLNARIQELEAMLEKQRAEAAATATIATPAKNVDELKRKVRNLTNQSRRDKQQLKDLQAENFKLKNKTEGLNQELLKTRQLLQKAENSARALRAKKTQLPTPTKPQPEDKKHERRVAELEQLLNERMEQVDSVRKAKAKADTDNKRLASRLEAAEKKAQHAEASVAKASKQLESMKSAAEMGAARRAEAADLKTMVRKHEDTIKQLNKELLQVQQQFTQLARADPTSTAALLDVQTKYEALKSSVDMGEDTTALVTRNAELSSQVARLEEAAAHAETVEKERDALKEQLQTVNATLTQLQEALEEAQRGAEAAPAEQGPVVDQLKDRIAEQESEITALTQAVEDAKRAAADQVKALETDYQSQVSALDKEVQAANNKVADARAKLLEQESTLKDTSARELELLDEIASLKRDLDTAREELRHKEEQVQEQLRKAQQKQNEDQEEEEAMAAASKEETAEMAVAAARARRGSKKKQDKGLDKKKDEAEEQQQLRKNKEAEEAERKKDEEAAKEKKKAEEAKKEAERKRKEQEEAERKRKEKEEAEEAERKRKEAEEAERKRKEEEEAERKRKEEEEEEERKRKEEEEKEAAEAERKRKEEEEEAEAERKRKEEEEAAEAERKRKEEEEAAEAERKRKEEEEAAEAERKRKEEEEAAEAERKRQEEEEAERKRKEEEEAAEAERQRKEEEEEAERKRQEEEEAERLRKQQEEQERAEAEADAQAAAAEGEEEGEEEEEPAVPLEVPPSEQKPDRYWRALYEYDPMLSSPNDFGADEELTLTEGEIIGTFGHMDDDGFFMGENARGQRGLVPSNFLEQLEEEEEQEYIAKAQGAPTTEAEQRAGAGEGGVMPPEDLALSDLRRDCAVVTWKLPLDLNPIDHYVVVMNGEQVAEIVDPTCSTAQIEETYQPGETYTVEVYSVGYEGEKSEPSRPLTFICPTEGTDAAAQEGEQPVRLFVALYDYDPETMSPNDEFEEELELKQGTVVKVLGDVGEDGFFLAEHNNKRGLIPSNFVEELSPETVSEFTDTADLVSQEDNSAEAEGEEPTALDAELHVGALVRALYDYIPEELSPNDDISEELPFHMHDLLRVVEACDDDGFLKCEHITTARQGYVPGNFVAPVPEDELEQANTPASPSASRSTGGGGDGGGGGSSSSTSSTKKKGFFKVFSKRS